MAINYLKHRGFTLIELMVVIAILGVLGAIAIPQYQQHVMSSNRKEAMIELTTTLVRLQECLNPEVNFTPDFCKQFDGDGKLTETGLYRIKLTKTDADNNDIYESFTLTAIAETSFQQKDTNCYHFIADSLGNKTSKDNSADPTSGCWK